LIKPDPAIYEHTLHGLGASAAETLFVDDREPNIRAAHALGMRAIQFTSVSQLKEDLEALGFPLLPAGEESPASGLRVESTAEQPDRQGKFSVLL
jgi:FMN phosphatase YigB (HAD superfamily)